MAELTELMRQLQEKRPDLAAASLSTYASALKRLKKISPEYEVGKIMAFLKTLSPPNARNHLTPLLILDQKKWKQHFDSFNESVEKLRVQQTPSANHEKNITSMAELKRLIRRMKEDIQTHKLFSKQNKNSTQRRLLIAYVSFVLLMDVTMRADSNSIKFAKTTSLSNETENWFILSTGTLSLNKFKTARSFRRRGMLPLLIRLKPKTLKILRLFTQNHNSGDYLFSMNNGKKMTKSQHSTILTGHSYRYLGVRLGVNMLRHLILSEFERGNPTLKERKDKMKRMQQMSLETQMSYAWRN